jgi:uncharacterized protein (TIGR03643 family)
MTQSDLPAVPENDFNGDMNLADVSTVIGMAWQDDTPFEAMALQFGLSEAQVIALMREHLKAQSFRVWRMRVRGRASKHQALQKAQSRTGTHNAANTAALWAPGPQDVLNESDPLALPLTGVTASSLR